jgi:hypothetical protein
MMSATGTADRSRIVIIPRTTTVYGDDISDKIRAVTSSLYKRQYAILFRKYHQEATDHSHPVGSTSGPGDIISAGDDTSRQHSTDGTDSPTDEPVGLTVDSEDEEVVILSIRSYHGRPITPLDYEATKLFVASLRPTGPSFTVYHTDLHATFLETRIHRPDTTSEYFTDDQRTTRLNLEDLWLTCIDVVKTDYIVKGRYARKKDWEMLFGDHAVDLLKVNFEALLPDMQDVYSKYIGYTTSATAWDDLDGAFDREDFVYHQAPDVINCIL